MAFVNEKESLRTVDYERDIILKCISRRPTEEHRTIFEIYWKDKKINFSADSKHEIPASPNTLLERPNKKVFWDIQDIFIPKDLFNKKAEIKEIIIEALKKRGFFCDDDNVKVKIKFSKHVSWHELKEK